MSSCWSNGNVPACIQLRTSRAMPVIRSRPKASAMESLASSHATMANTSSDNSSGIIRSGEGRGLDGPDESNIKYLLKVVIIRLEWRSAKVKWRRWLLHRLFDNWSDLQ